MRGEVILIPSDKRVAFLIIFLAALAVSSYIYWSGLHKKPAESVSTLTAEKKAQKNVTLGRIVKIFNTSSPVVWVGSLRNDEFLLVSMKSVVDSNNGNLSIHFGEGKIVAIHADFKNGKAEVIWNLSAGRTRIFSYPPLVTDSIFAAVENGPNRFNGSASILQISHDGKAREIATVDYFVFEIYPFEDGRSFLITGYDPSAGIGKAMVVAANEKPAFEQSGGDRIYSGYVMDVNGDNCLDIITARVFYSNHTSVLAFFVNESSDEGSKFSKVSELRVLGIVWEILPVMINGQEKLVVSGSRGIYLLSFNPIKILELYTSKNYTISPADVEDVDGDGTDEFFVLMHNETQKFIVGLKYTENSLNPFVKYRLELNAFPVKVVGNHVLIGAEDGLYYATISLQEWFR